MAAETVTLYRPTGLKELKLIAAGGFRHWPPRLPEQPIFYPVTNEEYAKDISINWNVSASGVGFVTKFCVKKSFMDRYQVHELAVKTILNGGFPLRIWKTSMTI